MKKKRLIGIAIIVLLILTTGTNYFILTNNNDDKLLDDLEAELDAVINSLDNVENTESSLDSSVQ